MSSLSLAQAPCAECRNTMPTAHPSVAEAPHPAPLPDGDGVGAWLAAPCSPSPACGREGWEAGARPATSSSARQAPNAAALTSNGERSPNVAASGLSEIGPTAAAIIATLAN